jgi:hypothetical protein
MEKRKMSEIRIQEAKNGAAQLSQGRFFLMVNKFLIKKGSNVGKGLIVVRMSELSSDKNNPDVGIFTEIKNFLLTPKQMENWIALLIQVSDKKLTPLKDGEKDADQKKL